MNNGWPHWASKMNVDQSKYGEMEKNNYSESSKKWIDRIHKRHQFLRSKTLLHGKLDLLHEFSTTLIELFEADRQCHLDVLQTMNLQLTDIRSVTESIAKQIDRLKTLREEWDEISKTMPNYKLNEPEVQTKQQKNCEVKALQALPAQPALPEKSEGGSNNKEKSDGENFDSDDDFAKLVMEVPDSDLYNEDENRVAQEKARNDLDRTAPEKRKKEPKDKGIGKSSKRVRTSKTTEKSKLSRINLSPIPGPSSKESKST